MFRNWDSIPAPSWTLMLKPFLHKFATAAGTNATLFSPEEERKGLIIKFPIFSSSKKFNALNFLNLCCLHVLRKFVLDHQKYDVVHSNTFQCRILPSVTFTLHIQVPCTQTYYVYTFLLFWIFSFYAFAWVKGGKVLTSWFINNPGYKAHREDFIISVDIFVSEKKIEPHEDLILGW